MSACDKHSVEKKQDTAQVASFRVVYDIGEGDPVVDVGAVTA